MERRLKILQTQFEYDLQLLETLEGDLKIRVQEELDNLKFEIDSLRRSSQLLEANVSNRKVLA